MDESEKVIEPSIMSEAFERVKAQGYKTDLVGDACFIYSKKLLDAVDAIKKEREAKAKSPIQEAKKEDIDTLPPPEIADSASGITAAPIRVPTREDLKNMIDATTKNYRYLQGQITALNNALDDMQAEIKVLSDKVKKLEQSKSSDSSDDSNINSKSD